MIDGNQIQPKTRKPFMTWAGLMLAASMLFSATSFQPLAGICGLLFLLFLIIGLADKYVTNRGVPVRKDRALNIFAWIVGGAAILTILLQLTIPAIHSVRMAAKRAEETKEAQHYIAPSDEQARAFANRLEEELASGNIDMVLELCDFNRLLERATAGVNAPEGARSAFIGGAKDSLGKGFTRFYRSGTFNLVRLQDKDKKKTATFRIILEEGGVGYVDIVLEKNNGSGIGIVDFYSYILGEKTSETMRRSYLMALEEQRKEQLDGSEQGIKNEIQFMDALTLLKLKRDANDFEGFAEIYSDLPSNIKNEKLIQMLYVQAASQQQDIGVYRQALKELSETFPRDPAMALMAVDGHVLNDDYDAALKSLDLVDASVGTDPYLNSVRANILSAKGESGRAMTVAKQFLKDFPANIDAHWTILVMSLENRDFDETANMLNKLETLFEVEITDLAEVPEYAEFIKSPAYSKWQASRAPK